jgi:outer membrane receptor protein involved in Fe transport
VYAFPSAFAATNSQVQSFQIGTPSLKPEIADTRTYGVVFNPEWFPVGKIGVSVDHYSIEVAGPISLRSIANIINGCVAAGGVSIPGNDCTLTPRNSSGQIDFVNQTRSNSGSLETSGMDINLRWSLDLEENLDLPGTFGIASLYTKVNHYKSNGVEAVGTHDGTIGGGVPKNRAATNFTYSVDDVNLLVRWTYTGPMDGGFDDTVQAWNVYEFGSSWDIDQNWQLQFGVENIFDKQPQKFAAAQAFGQFNVDGSTYDQLGRQYRFGLTWKN